ncbi:hypothetical protein EJ02DRAFT_469769 [Clathrospora elynae]|uniref:Zn(2)-C6 fungal-type domain-containing protein n=1 Tax=Clathrospora elynae TaxID=706981 RepID=A0A6A5S9X0_9PLEO|nr:hypothetical protein EJ02DRAFT_469769 [Clathrospora elynae]
MDPTLSNTPYGTSYHTPSRSPQENPYARISSRRAIACVTCAKAKTKCDKALPSCSRCVAKGIKCDPRSTRRTSDSNYRANVRKPFVPPRRYHSTNTSPYLSSHTSSRSKPSLNRHGAMRAASHIDFRTAVKMSQEDSGLSGYPVLTPLPTYALQIVDECYSYSSSPEQNTAGFTQAMESSNYSTNGRRSPQTPESSIYHEPLSMREELEYMTSQSWSNEALMSIELGFDPNIPAMLPTDIWPAPESEGLESLMQMAHMTWPQPAYSVSPQHIPADLTSHTRAVPSLSTSECSVEDFDTSDASQEEWLIYQPTATNMNLASLVTSAPFMHNINSVPNHAPVWADIFIPGASTY